MFMNAHTIKSNASYNTSTLRRFVKPPVKFMILGLVTPTTTTSFTFRFMGRVDDLFPFGS